MPSGIYQRTKEHNKNISLSHLGKQNPLWKGDKVGYNALHAWVKIRFSKPKLCQDCKKVPPVPALTVVFL